MLFNSPEFIFGFLPVALLGFFLLARWGARPALSWLTLASLFFYAWWDVTWLPLLVLSIAFNLWAGREISRRRPAHAPLVAAITINLGPLAYFKYGSFLASTVGSLVGSAIDWPATELPLGISFFTFTQIAFLADVYQRKTEDFDPVRYGLFVTYFPHLIAGPVLHHKEMMPQFERPDIFRFDANRLADGGAIFILGLFKKTVLADAFGGYARPAFAAAGSTALTFFEAWSAALSYTLQIYFDFSGYSDMAIGLALMIGIRLPLNFHSPYKARNVAEFWRRWHMTLSRFLRDYLYIPLGGNRRGPVRQQVNLMTTMLLGGLWHGAGWTFVVWGGLHGLLLVVHRLWSQVRPQLPVLPAALRWPAAASAWALTFFSVVVCWVFFRAEDFGAALAMLRGMAGAHGALLPDQLLALAPPLGTLVQGAGKVPYLADGTVMGAVEMFVMITLGMLLVLAAPAMSELRNRTRYLLVVPCAALALQRVLYGSASEFLYFQF
jgi:D-alanyl-lipoteichoic acid acyltransferase DltB (MBOAT superfamily)